LAFFGARGHHVVASDSLVPQNDPSVLFTSAGMNQFKDQFMGKITDFRRAASSQKCLRTADLINVGKSPSHHTFFEMLGNFSFGDYFKSEAICWAWEFVTKELGLPAERLWVSVHTTDDEAYAMWLNQTNVPAARIVRLGDADNFWPANAPQDGPNGPCGPCSEIFYDWGQAHGCGKPDCSPACSCKRFTEIWNLVFTQYNRQPDGSLAPLPSKNIDTGMGLERITSVSQGVRSNYETDLFVPIIESLREQLSRLSIAPESAWFLTQARAISDHMRAVTFAIADGVVPSNEERGYVIRKLLRRSIIMLKRVGVNKPFCYRLVYPLAQVMAEPYPEVMRRHETIAGIIKKDEEAFWTILTERAPQAEDAFLRLAAELKSMAPDDPRRRESPARTAFVNYDTFGIPLEMSREIAGEFGLEIDEEAFESEMEKQRQRSRSGTQMSTEIFARSLGRLLHGIPATAFLGYTQMQCAGQVRALVKNNVMIDQALAGEIVEVVLDQTPFYAESGGQAGDQGVLRNGSRVVGAVQDTKKCDEFIVHSVLLSEPLRVNDTVSAEVDMNKRAATARNHTATHLLQYALRRVLGDQVEQAGSFVSGEKLRFDFTHLSALSGAVLRQVETLVNEAIWQNYPVSAQVKDLASARQSGALAFFQEKYGATVRVLSVGEISREFCGGTHVNATGEIGLFKILSESSVAQGVRRIEALTAVEALGWYSRAEGELARLAGLLKVDRERIGAAVEKILEQNRAYERELQRVRMSSLAGEAEKLLAQAPRVSGITIVAADMDTLPVDALRSFCDTMKAKQDPVICVLGSCGPKPLLLVAVSKSLAQRNVDAVSLIRELMKKSGASGGGRPELAQAGTKDKETLQQTLREAPSIVSTYLNERGVV